MTPTDGAVNITKETRAFYNGYIATLLPKINKLARYYNKLVPPVTIVFKDKLYENWVGSFNFDTLRIEILSNQNIISCLSTILHEFGHYIDMCNVGVYSFQNENKKMKEYRAWEWVEKFLIMWPECSYNGLYCSDGVRVLMDKNAIQRKSEFAGVLI